MLGQYFFSKKKYCLMRELNLSILSACLPVQVIFSQCKKKKNQHSSIQTNWRSTRTKELEYASKGTMWNIPRFETAIILFEIDCCLCSVFERIYFINLYKKEDRHNETNLLISTRIESFVFQTMV